MEAQRGSDEETERGELTHGECDHRKDRAARGLDKMTHFRSSEMDPRPQAAVAGAYSAAGPRKTNKADSFRNVQEQTRRRPYDGRPGDEVVAPTHKLCGRQGLLEDESETNEATAGGNGAAAGAASDSRHGQSLRRRANPLLHSLLGAKARAAGGKTKARAAGGKTKVGLQGARQRLGLQGARQRPGLQGTCGGFVAGSGNAARHQNPTASLVVGATKTVSAH